MNRFKFNAFVVVAVLLNCTGSARPEGPELQIRSDFVGPSATIAGVTLFGPQVSFDIKRGSVVPALPDSNAAKLAQCQEGYEKMKPDLQTEASRLCAAAILSNCLNGQPAPECVSSLSKAEASESPGMKLRPSSAPPLSLEPTPRPVPPVKSQPTTLNGPRNPVIVTIIDSSVEVNFYGPDHLRNRRLQPVPSVIGAKSEPLARASSQPMSYPIQPPTKSHRVLYHTIHAGPDVCLADRTFVPIIAPCDRGTDKLFTVSATVGSTDVLIVSHENRCLSLDSGRPVLTRCNASHPDQLWSYTANGQLRSRMGGALVVGPAVTDGSLKNPVSAQQWWFESAP